MHTLRLKNVLLVYHFYSPCPEDDEAIQQSWWMRNSDFSIADQVHKQRRKRRRAPSDSDVSTISAERNVETLVVADPKMVGYHTTEGIEKYLLTLMNIVSIIASFNAETVMSG